MATTNDDPQVVTERARVRRQWNDWKIGEVALNCLRDFQWRRVSGGVGAVSHRPFLRARMWCDALLSGEVSHSGVHGPCPHEILVCIVQKDNSRELFKRLRAMVPSAPLPDSGAKPLAPAID